GDLAYAVDAASYKGVRVEVVSLRAMTSDSLINVSDRYIDLDGIKGDICKTSRGSNSGVVQHNYTYRPLSSISVLDEAQTARP
ncbi:MAG: NYN domain-containing protein, partial [Cyanobacteria bacterium J06554_11]